MKGYIDEWVADIEDLRCDMLFGDREDDVDEVFENNANREAELCFVQATAHMELAIYNLKLCQLKLV
jgi:hypothetical protein